MYLLAQVQVAPAGEFVEILVRNFATSEQASLRLEADRHFSGRVYGCNFTRSADIFEEGSAPTWETLRHSLLLDIDGGMTLPFRILSKSYSFFIFGDEHVSPAWFFRSVPAEGVRAQAGRMKLPNGQEHEVAVAVVPTPDAGEWMNAAKLSRETARNHV